MDSGAKLHMSRAEDELLLSETDMKISTDTSAKETFGIPESKTFFHSVISHAYYCIFHSAKAYLLSRGIKTSPPEEHRKTDNEFKRFVETGKLNRQLLEIYQTEAIKAEALLKIFFREKRKRGIFTYNVRSEANIPYATESIKNAKKFASAIKAVLESLGKN